MAIGIMALVFILFLVSGVPVGGVLGISSLITTVMDPWFPADSQYIVRAMINGVNSFPMLAVPMFILSGNIMAKGKISEKIFDFFAYFAADKTAGLPIATVCTCLFYGAISGSGPATTAAVGAMTIPVLVNAGYKKEFVTALVAVAGGIGVVIPPSIPFIFFGQASGVSVSDMFIAGIIPGILIGLSLMMYSWYYCRKNWEDKERLLEYRDRIRGEGIVYLMKESILALICPIIVLGSIYSGIASPTEAAVISVFYALFVSVFIYRTIKWNDLKDVLRESIKTYSTILFIIAAATAFSRVLIFMKIPDMLAESITSSVSSGAVLIVLINIMLLFVGMVMDTTPAILILTPIFVPIVAKFGIDPVHFGIIMVVNLAIGFVTPPLGVNLFVASTITDIEMEKIVKNAVPFIAAFIAVLIVISFVPAISTILL